MPDHVLYGIRISLGYSTRAACALSNGGRSLLRVHGKPSFPSSKGYDVNVSLFFVAGTRAKVLVLITADDWNDGKHYPDGAQIDGQEY